MRGIFILVLCALITGCDMDMDDHIIVSSDPIHAALNRWTSQRLWPVLDAQDRRDAAGLCVLLQSGEPEVRRSAALAFASVQDTLGIPCLLAALDDRMSMVRASAAYALGIMGDGPAIDRMAEAASSERDSTVLLALRSAGFMAKQCHGMLATDDILLMLNEGAVHDRIRAADALRRLADSTLSHLRPELQRSMLSEGPEVRQFLILAMGKAGDDADQDQLQMIVVEGTPGERVNALRALGTSSDIALRACFEALGDPIMNSVALEQLERFGQLDGKECLQMSDSLFDKRTRIVLLGLAVEHGDKQVVADARSRLEGIDTLGLSTYMIAESIRARYRKPQENALEELVAIIRSDRPAPERQAAFQAALRVARDQMESKEQADPAGRFAQLKELFEITMMTRDAGLISAAAEELLKEGPTTLMKLYAPDIGHQVMETLHPLKDLEARLLLAQLQAKRYGVPKPEHHPPPYVHPIDKNQLTRLQQGQQYRVSTSKGTIILATRVNEAPGTSLAFDSLVTAGFYDGKSFHRVVPNFVVQGGCPRGDGYGGMPWTLRTEIGLTPFTAGSLGLASAGPDTESSQFFITHSATPHLDGRYTNFGQVVDGMDVVWRIEVGDVIHHIQRQ